MTMNTQHNSKPKGCRKSSSKREVYHNTSLPKTTRETEFKQTNPTPKATRKRTKSSKLVEGQMGRSSRQKINK